MFWIDGVVVAGLLVSLLGWWRRREGTALAGAIAVLAAGGYGLLLDRWQYAAALIVAAIILLLLTVRRRPEKVPYRSGALFSFLAVVTVALLYLFPIRDLPKPSGEHGVGVRDFVLTDASRTGVLAAAADAPRELLVRAWYPARVSGADAPRPYFTPLEAATTGGSLGAFVDLPFLFKYIRHVRTNSFVDAPLIAAPETLPVVFFSHGYTSFAGQNTALMEDLASHGYLVFSVHHSHDSAPAVLPDGRLIDTDPQLFSDMAAQTENEAAAEELLDGFIGPSPEARHRGVQALYRSYMDNNYRIAAVSARVWVADRRFVHDALAAADVPANVADLAAVGDFDRTGQIGMSFGGSTTGALCQEDRRCAAAVNMDGGDYHYDTTFGRNMSVPFLMLYSDLNRMASLLSEGSIDTGHGFNDFSYERFETTGLRQDVHRLMIRDVMHLGVSDFTLFLRNPLRGLLLGPIDPDAMLDVQNDVVRGFFDRYLRRANNGFPRAELEKHAAWVQVQDTRAVREWWLGEHPEDVTVPVRMETSLGNIDVAIYPLRAPLSAAKFLEQVDAGTYTNTSLYRVTRRSEDPRSIAVVQGGRGISRAFSAEHVEPVSHETTDLTGMPNARGTIAFARLAPGTASTEFFFNVEDNPVLDTGNTMRNPDGQGYATFGRVLSGLRILEGLADRRRGANAELPARRGEMLVEPITVHTIRRISAP